MLSATEYSQVEKEASLETQCKTIHSLQGAVPRFREGVCRTEGPPWDLLELGGLPSTHSPMDIASMSGRDAERRSTEIKDTTLPYRNLKNLKI